MFEAKFQSFADPAAANESAARVKALRATLAERGLAGFLVPRADAHQNEYVPRSAERLAWLTGFTGSAGFAVILATKAAIFVDGRYVIQVRGEIDPRVMTPLDISTIAPATWLAENAPDGARIDVTADPADALRMACTSSSGVSFASSHSSTRAMTAERSVKIRPKNPYPTSTTRVRAKSVSSEWLVITRSKTCME